MSRIVEREVEEKRKVEKQKEGFQEYECPRLIGMKNFLSEYLEITSLLE
jgi:hypothetical protein